MLGEYRTKIAAGFLCRGRRVANSATSSPRSLLSLILAYSLAAGFLVLSFSLAAPRAAADAGIVLNESLDTSVARITGSGHSAIYLSRICPDNSPAKMRLCRPGEEGSVLSNYTTLGEDQPYEWNIVPLSVYLYGVEDPRNRPLVSSKEIKAALEERYRQNYLSAICTGNECLTGHGAEWREMVGATLERSMYMFIVKTSVAQDEALVAEFNVLPNVNHFNGLTRNCADFSRRVMNFYFPGAVSPDYINDFLITTPKAVAHSLTRYAAQHPELDLRVLHFAQVPGTIKRSYECRSGTEEIYHSKKFLIPLGVFAWQGIPAAFSTYALTGRFNPEHQFEAHASIDAVGPDDASGDAANDSFEDVTPDEVQAIAGHATTISSAGITDDGNGAFPPAAPSADTTLHSEAIVHAGYTVSVQQLAAEQQSEKREIVGTKDQWTEYQKQFPGIVDQAIREEIIPDRGYLNRVFKRLGQSATLHVDPDGALWMSLPNQDLAEKVGISASNIFAAGSDSMFAYQIVLARMEYELKSPKHSRETMMSFQYDWNLMTNAHAKSRAFAAAQRHNSAPFSAAAASTRRDSSEMTPAATSAVN